MPVLERHDPLAPTRIERGGRRFDFDAVPVTVATVGDTAFTAWGDGRLRAFRPGSDPEVLDVHKGAVLSMVAEASGLILTGGDDGRFCRVTPEGVTEIADFPANGWTMSLPGQGVSSPARPGARCNLWDGLRREVLETPSTVGGLAFDRKGGRLAVAHYGGVTIWAREKRGWKPSTLKWAGSHTAVSFSPMTASS